MRITLFVLLLSYAHSTFGQSSIKEGLKAFPDTVGLAFAEIKQLEKKGKIEFKQLDTFSSEVNIYWVKIQEKDLGDAEYLYLSQYFDRIEAYYPGNDQSFTLSGRLVEFSERGYKKGFYLNVVNLKPNNGHLYLKLITNTGYSTSNRTLSNMEAVSSQEFEYNTNLTHAIILLLSGMAFIILLVNLILLYLRPSPTLATYIFLIIISILLVNVAHQSFVGVLEVSAFQLQRAEIILNILITGVYSIFTAFYLKAYKHSKILFYVLVFPFFLIQIAFINLDNSWFLKASLGFYFLVYFMATVLLIFKVWKKEKQNCIIYLIANGPSIVGAMLTILAVNNVLPSTFFTTSAVYMSLLLRDTIFTLAWVNHYFQLQKETLSSKLEIQQLKDEKKQLKRVEKLKTQFFNNVSQGLKTPLSLVISPLESSLKNDKLPPRVRKDLHFSLENSKKIVQQVDEMMELSKLDDAELTAVCQPTNINVILNEIKLGFLAEAQQKNQKFVLYPTKKDIIARIDQDKFEKIMNILISNALKYNEKPGNIYFKIEKDENDLKVRIRDEGVGIASKDLPRIFDRYYQSKKASEKGGTGIGLFIVKEFMQLHDGTVKCFSLPGEGATFTLIFPDAIVEDFDNDLDSTISDVDRSKQTILLVEDEPFMRNYLKKELSDYNSVEAADGQKALKLLEEGILPDLILTDYMMPNLDGYELAIQLKRNPKWMDIPIIFLSATNMSAEKIKVLNLGIDDYIVKPFNVGELKVRIKNALNFSNARKKPLKDEKDDLDIENLQSFKIKLDNYILKNLKSTNLSNELLTKKLHLSERNLFRKVKAVTGQTPASYIREIRLQKARELMDNQPEMRIGEVAQECGLDNLAHFSQSFKKRFGKTPKDYSSVNE
ncbi:ATP-binding protein [Marivirga sp.]|uniref:ATP-binding protein n=1 Tax=Marivirga sp. TaxID=2018662 RepID=UPI002D7FE7C4|nr:ATP-binding protein [Marivirga sp.]HET8860017.1 ATP-binding protein [Marivirga sp.]